MNIPGSLMGPSLLGCAREYAIATDTRTRTTAVMAMQQRLASRRVHSGAHRSTCRRAAVVCRASAVVQPYEVKALVNDKGFTFIDVRTPEEHAEGAKRYMKSMPVAFMSEKGPRMNNRFKQEFVEMFPNKMSRVLIACDDGTDRTELAYGMIEELGYSSVKVVEGGIFAVLEVDPLDAKDKAPKWRLVGQTSGVRYAFNDGAGAQKGDFDDGA
ncbi:rhodanese domain-containing protein [Haematococcus lacustris]|uniref:Rhodanese domain-containing protein n=1 Tax=Haematococcus lacustris TaxID=44745 RepID=A0A699YV58_HAELA|nr:rhodanese domain-containing protein [Haematococcus lacustris]